MVPEENFLDAGDEEPQICETEFGKVGVLICADSWVPKSYERLKKCNVDIIAVPIFVSPADSWESKWSGENFPKFDKNSVFE